MQRLLGVDVDSKKLRFTVAEFRFRRLQVLKSGETVLPEDRGQHAEAFSEALRRWKQEFAPGGVVIGLPLRWFSWTHLDLPVMAGEDLRRALRFELEKHLPLPADDYRLDFLSAKSEQRMRTLVFSARKDVVDTYAKAVADAGIKLLSIRCRTMDLLNSVTGMTGASLQGILIHASDEDYELAAVGNDGAVHVQRVSKASDLQGELESVRQHYPGKLYVSGDSEPQLPERIGAEKTYLAPSHALLLSIGRKKKFALEFIPPELARHRRDLYPYAIAGCAATAAAFFLLTGIVAYLKDIYTLNTTERKISAIQTQAAGVIEARKRLDALRDDRNTLVDFFDRSNLAIRAMSELSQSVPDDTWIINLSLDDKGSIELEGFSRKTADLVLALEKSGHFRAISFSAPIISREGEERFSLKLEVKR